MLGRKSQAKLKRWSSRNLGGPDRSRGLPQRRGPARPRGTAPLEEVVVLHEALAKAWKTLTEKGSVKVFEAVCALSGVAPLPPSFLYLQHARVLVLDETVLEVTCNPRCLDVPRHPTVSQSIGRLVSAFPGASQRPLSGSRPASRPPPRRGDALSDFRPAASGPEVENRKNITVKPIEKGRHKTL